MTERREEPQHPGLKQRLEPLALIVWTSLRDGFAVTLAVVALVFAFTPWIGSAGCTDNRAVWNEGRHFSGTLVTLAFVVAAIFALVRAFPVISGRKDA